MDITEEQINQMASNARRNALKDAAKAICPFCRGKNPWSDAQSVDGTLYEHFEVNNPNNKRICAVSTIWQMIDAE